MSNYLLHSGKGHDDNPPGRGSGRYPYGSGERPYQGEKKASTKRNVGVGIGVGGIAGLLTAGVLTIKKILGMADKVTTMTSWNTLSNVATATKFVNGSQIATMKVPVSLLADLGLLF